MLPYLYENREKGTTMCDAHEDDVTLAEEEAGRLARTHDGWSGCEAHRRNQAEAEQICKEQGHEFRERTNCICCGKPQGT